MSKQTDAKLPAIKFQTFDKDWQEKQIGKVLSETNRPIVLEDDQRYELVTVKRRNEGVVSRGYLYGHEILVKNYSQLAEGDYLISKRQVVHGATGIVPAALDGAIVSNEYLVAVGNGDISTEFLTLMSKRPAMYRKFFLSSYGVVIEKLFFDVEDWKKRTVTIPELDEQTEICSWFESLDRMTGLNQRKHDKLVTLKQAMLRKMYPQGNATVPEVRFKGFTEPWEARQLDSVGEFNPKATLPEVFEYVDLGSVVGTQMIDHRTELKDSAPSRAQRLARTGDLFFQTVRPYQKNNHLFKLLRDDFVFSTGYAQIRPFNDGGFLLAAMQRNEFLRVVLAHCTGTSYPAINSKVLAKIEVSVPSPSEQKQIGQYFSDIDDLISTYAAQLKKLKNIKSACLEKMFV